MLKGSFPQEVFVYSEYKGNLSSRGEMFAEKLLQLSPVYLVYNSRKARDEHSMHATQFFH